MTPLRSSPRRTPRAFATLTALTLLAFLGTLSLLLSTHLRSQAARTRRDADQAQLRQLLHAGHLLASDFPALWS
ncbi:MAG TPA: hypothetical protein VFE58_09545, partial [Tepidisphaeraceae bacterium]|nr:hypothetical protein [Tepidisphaeraceae bacterium]